MSVTVPLSSAQRSGDACCGEPPGAAKQKIQRGRLWISYCWLPPSRPLHHFDPREFHLLQSLLSSLSSWPLPCNHSASEEQPRPAVSGVLQALAHALGVATTYAHGIQQVRQQRDEDKVMSTVQQRAIGLGLYATASFMNHSCLPNCMVRFQGR